MNKNNKYNVLSFSYTFFYFLYFIIMTAIYTGFIEGNENIAEPWKILIYRLGVYIIPIIIILIFRKKKGMLKLLYSITFLSLLFNFLNIGDIIAILAGIDESVSILANSEMFLTIMMIFVLQIEEDKERIG